MWAGFYLQRHDPNTHDADHGAHPCTPPHPPQPMTSAHLAVMSYAPMLMPTGSHATMMRDSASTLLVSWNEVTPGVGSRVRGR